jgi:hypothetical protein
MVACHAIFAPNYWMRFFAVIKRTLDANTYLAILAASRQNANPTAQHHGLVVPPTRMRIDQ